MFLLFRSYFNIKIENRMIVKDDCKVIFQLQFNERQSRNEHTTEQSQSTSALCHSDTTAMETSPSLSYCSCCLTTNHLCPSLRWKMDHLKTEKNSQSSYEQKRYEPYHIWCSRHNRHKTKHGKKKNKKEKHILIFLTAACEVSVITD